MILSNPMTTLTHDTCHRTKGNVHFAKSQRSFEQCKMKSVSFGTGLKWSRKKKKVHPKSFALVLGLVHQSEVGFHMLLHEGDSWVPLSTSLWKNMICLHEDLTAVADQLGMVSLNPNDALHAKILGLKHEKLWDNSLDWVSHLQQDFHDWLNPAQGESEL